MLALQAYWIIKFKPFSIRNIDKAKKHLHINEMIALFLIISAVKESSLRNNKASFRISEEFINRLHYDLCYWDLSKEALMLVSEVLAE